MGMRKQFVDSTRELMEMDLDVVTLLGDIGVFGFRHLMGEYGGKNGRIYNVGILEQATISMAAGLALAGLVPVVHTISPFLAERAYEQLKLDFGYQGLNGNFVGVGGSYDYSKLGSTHCCPADVGALRQIPNMQILLPGTSQEFHQLYKFCYRNGQPTYYRLSERENKNGMDKVEPGKANVIKRGRKGTVIAVGVTLDAVIEATEGLDVSVLYYSSIRPFDHQALREATGERNILMVEPYYYGAASDEIIAAFQGERIQMDFVGVPHEFLTNYGTVEQNDIYCGITAKNIHERMGRLIYG